MKQQFEVGDKVRAFGIDGVVSVVARGRYGITVYFEGSEEPRHFMHDGVYMRWHKEPSLFLVEKAKEEEPIVQWYHATYQPTSRSRPLEDNDLFTSKEDFLAACNMKQDDFYWIKLTPACKTQGNKLVEE